VERATLLLGQVVAYVLDNDLNPGIVGHSATVRFPHERGNQSGRLPQVIDPPEPSGDLVPTGRWQGRGRSPILDMR
jgi:hypothetical protein